LLFGWYFLRGVSAWCFCLARPRGQADLWPADQQIVSSIR
jgi:hypothetical protein